ncbi:MAG: BadF/BadG/BcrA/BcrD ATPase family protein [Pseudomonadota bacterium]
MHTYFLGIDGGGSKCRAALCTGDGTVVGQGVSGPANPFQSIRRSTDSVEAAVAAALADAGLDRSQLRYTHAGVGLAGVNLPTFYRKIAAWPHAFASMHLTTDLEVACYGAHGGPDGAVIVAGTGSSAYVSVRGRQRIYGAHGFMFGDTGSGAWLGHEALKAVLLADDDLGPSTTLSAAFEEIMGCGGVQIIERMTARSSSDFAALAPAVFAAAGGGDAVATGIVERGAAYLDGVAERLWQSGPPRMSLLGGLREPYLNWLSPTTLNRLSQPAEQPVMGAVLFVRGKVVAGEQHGTAPSSSVPR